MTAARLFFALWPDERLRSQLQATIPSLLHGVRGKPQRPDQWHVTLEFLGEVTAERQPAIRAAASNVQCRAGHVSVTFDHLEHWRRPQVLCLVAAQVPAALGRLVAELHAALRAEGFVPESREYRPHVTLARKVGAAPVGPVPSPVVWHADRFALVQSVADAAGSRYEPLQWWNLRGREG